VPGELGEIYNPHSEEPSNAESPCHSEMLRGVYEKHAEELSMTYKLGWTGY
jgi:hypothetical protein